MKKIYNIFVLVAAAAMALVSCNKQEVEAPKPQEVEYEYTFEIAGDTKAFIGDNCVVWESGDQIGVYTDGQNGMAHNAGGVKFGSSVSFSIKSSKALVVGDNVHCYYPYASENSDDVRTVNMSIATAQTEKDQMPMVSLPFTVTEDLAANTEKPVGQILFANLGSVIEFHVYSTTEEYQSETIQSVTFNADKAIAGDFVFDLAKVDYSKEETLEISGYEATTVVSSLSTPVEVPAEKEAAKVVKMVVAPGTYAGNVVVTTDKATYTFPITTAKEFKRSSVKPLGLNLREDVRQANTVEPVEVVATLTFDDKAKRTEYSTTIQVWEENGIKLTNNKAASTTNIGDYANPARFYKSSTITIEAPGNITEIIFNTSGSDYVSDLKAILSSATASGNSVTAELDGTSNTVTYALTSGQVRLNSITVTYSSAGENPDQPENPEPEVVTLSSIKVSDDAKTKYTVGEEFVEPTVVATYSDNTTKEVDAAFSGYNMKSAGTQTVTVSYTEGTTVTTTYDITVEAPVVDDTDYSGIYAIVAYRNSESKFYYMTNEETTSSTKRLVAVVAGTECPTDGITLNASKLWKIAKSGSTYMLQSVESGKYVSWSSDNSATMSDSGLEFNISKNDDGTYLLNNGERNLSLNNSTGSNYFAMYRNTMVDDLYLVEAVEGEEPAPILTGISVSGQTTTFNVGDTFNFNGVVTATYSDNTSKTVTATSVSSPNMSVAGNPEVIVTYIEGEVTATAKYTITVSAAAATKKYYKKVTTAPTDWSGTYLIVAGTSAANGTITSKWLKYNSVTISNNQIESTAAVDAIAVTIKKESNGNYSIRFANGNYLGTTTSNDGIKVATSVGTGFYWKFSVASSLVKIESTVQSSRILRLNGTSGFRTYTSSTGTQATLYKLQD